MAMREPKELSGVEKASVLLMAMGATTSAQVLKHLSESEIERLSAEIIRLRQVEPAIVEGVVADFERACASVKRSGISGGRDFVEQVLEQVVGAEKAGELLQKAGRPSATHRFEFLWEADADVISQMLKEEQPQIVALVLVSLPREKAAAVLSQFDEGVRTRIALNICSMEDVDPEVVAAIEDALHVKLAASSAQVVASAGPKTLVEILNNAGRATERVVLEALQKDEPSFGEQVRGMMFIFEDLPRLDDRTIQSVLREIDQEDLRLALKGADDTIKELIFKNMSERAAETLKEDLELAGAVKVKDIEAAQHRVVSVVRRLLASGEIALVDSEEEMAA